MEFTKEEKNAIEFLNEQLDKEENDDFCPVCLHNYLVIILDLVEKQQKEIEELKKQNYEIVKELKPRVQIDDTEYIERNFISKDKIREKIKEYQEKAEDVKQKYKGVYAYKDDYLEALAKIEGYQELLEEN